MDLTDLKFSIKDPGISSSDGELTISELSGILSGVINNTISDAKTILTVTAIDGQSTDIDVNWEIPTLKVSGFEDYTDMHGYKQNYSKLNGTYKINSADNAGIFGHAGTPGEEWCNLQVTPWQTTPDSEPALEFFFAYFGPDESFNQSIHDITQDLNDFENWSTFTIPFKIYNTETGEIITEQLITIECNF